MGLNRKSQGLKRSQVPQCLNSGKEKISAALERREGWQAGYFSADRTFGDSEVETTVLSSNKWVSFVPEFVKIRVVDPDILRELELSHEACTKNERGNSTIGVMESPPSSKSHPSVAWLVPERIETVKRLVGTSTNELR